MIKQFYLTIPGQNGPKSNGNEWVLHIPQSFKTLVGGVVESLLSAVGVFNSSSWRGIILSSVILLVTLYVMVGFFAQRHVNFRGLFKVTLYKYKYINKFVVQY